MRGETACRSLKEVCAAVECASRRLTTEWSGIAEDQLQSSPILPSPIDAGKAAHIGTIDICRQLTWDTGIKRELKGCGEDWSRGKGVQYNHMEVQLVGLRHTSQSANQGNRQQTAKHFHLCILLRVDSSGYLWCCRIIDKLQQTFKTGALRHGELGLRHTKSTLRAEIKRRKSAIFSVPSVRLCRKLHCLGKYWIHRQGDSPQAHARVCAASTESQIRNTASTFVISSNARIRSLTVVRKNLRPPF